MRGLKVFETTRHFLYTLLWLALKKLSKSLIMCNIKVTCALKWACKLSPKTLTYANVISAFHATPIRVRTHNGFVSDLLKWALKCRFYATGPSIALHCISGTFLSIYDLLSGMEYRGPINSTKLLISRSDASFNVLSLNSLKEFSSLEHYQYVKCF